MNEKVRMLFILFLLITFFMGLYMYAYWYFEKNPLKIDQSALFNNNDTTKEDNVKTNASIAEKETPTNPISNNNNECAKLLIRRGMKVYLYNNTIKDEPIVFDSLKEYVDYLEKQRTNGIRCPVLYLQQENDTQGNDVYRIRSNPTDQNSGFDFSKKPSEFGLKPYMENFEGDSDTSGNTPQSLPNQPQPGTEPKTPVQERDADREFAPYNSGQYNGFDSHGQYVGTYTNIDQIHDSTSKNHISDNPMDDNWGGVLYTQQAVDSGKYKENDVYRPNLYTPANSSFYPFAVGNNNIPPPTNGFIANKL